MRSNEAEADDGPSRRAMYLHPVFLVLLGLVIGVFAGYAIASPAVLPAPDGRHGPPTPPHSPTDRTIPGEGIYWVGEDVQPGLYRSAGSTESDCRWKRTMDVSGDKGALIARDSTTGRAYARLRAGEFFVTDGCHRWNRVIGQSSVVRPEAMERG